jgi:CRISPR-associated protein Cas6
MADKILEMIDLVFDLDGGILPGAYPFALWAALLRHFPQLAEERHAGVLPLRLSESHEGLLLPKRAKLVLRLPAALADQAVAGLQGRQLDVNGSLLRLGAGKKRTIQPSPTLHAQMVTGASDEVLFMDSINAQLRVMGIAANLICGMRRTLNDDRQTIHGYSLVAHDLKPEDSLRLQYAGLGEGRQFGCGIFVPYKVISGLD